MAKSGKIINCNHCGIETFKTTAKLKRSKNLFCSVKCFDLFRLNKIIVLCSVCGKKTERVQSKIINGRPMFCSRKCMSIGRKGINVSGFFKKGNTGAKCINYKNGTQTVNGYMCELVPEHPHASKKGYVYQHRLVMEKHIGRYLNPKEAVHHINHNKKDNRIENLMLFENDSEHHKYHNKIFRHGSQLLINNKYVSKYKPKHPFCSKKGYIPEHRLMMEKHLGRFLNKEEVVHHINFDKKDNRIENLMLFPSNSAHTKHHRKLRKIAEQEFITKFLK